VRSFALLPPHQVQGSRAINAHVTRLEEIEVLVRNGAVVSEPLKVVLAHPATAKGTPANWCEMYKTVAYMYTAADSLSVDMHLPPLDSVDLVGGTLASRSFPPFTSLLSASLKRAPTNVTYDTSYRVGVWGKKKANEPRGELARSAYELTRAIVCAFTPN
jgi:hypothetical protein